MPLSFAQNSEDVLLWRCFGAKKSGVYIDVGASSPITDSVTHLFYEHGWSGLNLDPLPERVAELSRLRPRDRTLQLAVGSAPGRNRLQRQRGMGGLSTLLTPNAPELTRHFSQAWEIEIQVMPFSQILEQEKIGEIDFIKIDVEGAEVQVLGSLDLSRWRPAVILVEATLPMTQTPSHQAWEPLILSSGYDFCWYDGLNRFYLAKERAELTRHFQTPPNVHDAMPRFAGFGSALRNEGHPDHNFAVHFASLLLRAPGVETDAYLEQVMRKDRPAALFDGPVDEAGALELYLLVLGRRPDPTAVEKLTRRPITGTKLLRQLITSDEFRNRRSRIAWG